MCPNIWIALLLTIQVTKTASQSACQPSPCGTDSVCSVTANQAACSCPVGFYGNPFVECTRAFYSLDGFAENPTCLNNSQCNQNRACSFNMCADPCPGKCSIDYGCEVFNHTPICVPDHAYSTVIPPTTPHRIEPHKLLPNNTVCGIGGWFEDFPWMALIIYEKNELQTSDSLKIIADHWQKKKDIEEQEFIYNIYKDTTYKISNYTDFYFCGGSLINKRYILTSAGCMRNTRRHALLEVRLGEYNLDTDPDCLKGSVSGVYCAPSPVKVQVEEVIIHEDYLFYDKNQYHDIALLRLQEEVNFTETVRPICMPYIPEEHNRPYFGKKLTVAGWGETETKKISSTKRKVKVPLNNKVACRSKYNESNVDLGDGQFCAGGEKGRDACRGDNGNALMAALAATVDENLIVNYYAVGVVSFGPGLCGVEGWPSVYTNISAYIPWILNKLKP